MRVRVFYRKIGNVIEFMSYATGFIAGWMIIGAGVLMMSELVTRYVLRRPLIIADELSGYAMVGIGLLGLAFTFQQKSHIRITFLTSVLPPKVSKCVRLLTLGVAAIWVAIASKSSLSLVQSSFQRGIRSITLLMTPLAWPQMAIALGFIVLLLMIILNIAKTINNSRSMTGEE